MLRASDYGDKNVGGPIKSVKIKQDKKDENLWHVIALAEQWGAPPDHLYVGTIKREVYDDDGHPIGTA